MGMGEWKRHAPVLLLLHVALSCWQARVLYSQHQPCNPVDLKALEGFAEGLGSGALPNWVFNASSPSPVCCEWAGVICDNSSNRVVGLHLANMNLSGSVSNSLVDLDQLRELDLSVNFLCGALPHELFHLKKLQVLNLSQNSFSGVLPKVSVLPSIRDFNISYNQFNGSLPMFTNWSKLANFDVGHNYFGGAVDSSMCRFSSQIEILSFSSNMFYGNVPTGFGNCTLIQKLCLDTNGISGNLPDDLFKLTSLRELHLQNNRLEGRISPAIGNLSNLIKLDLSSNAFVGTFPYEIGSLRMLQYLSISSNYFTGDLPPSLSNLSAIEVLNLRNNSFGGELNIVFSNMRRLSSLDLGSNRFSGNVPFDLSYCLQLETVNLARNMFHGGIPDGFRNLTALSFLSLSNNSFYGISSVLGVLQHCPNLSGLVLTLNFKDERLPPDGIQGFRNLKLLVVANCGLFGNIPLWLGQCKQLQLLDLSWNHLGGDIPPLIGDLDLLFYLDLSNNSLTGILPQSLTNMTALSSRGPSQQLSSPTVPFFSKQSRRAKGLQYNQLSSFPPSLILSGNKLTGNIWPHFGCLKKLHVLDLSNNCLSGVIPEELSGMSSLEVLDLSRNTLSGIIPASFTKLTFLSRLNLSYNQLVGPIPDDGQFSTFANSSFVGNLGLCSERLISCRGGDSLEAQRSSRKGKKKGIIAGIAFGSGCGATFVFALIYLFISRKQSRRVKDAEREVIGTEGQLEFSGSRLVLLFQNKDNKEITVDDLLKSTNNFDQANIIGCGGFGLVYKAILPGERMVAVKRLSGDCGQMEREFQAEVEALSKVQHRNLVLLQGYCRLGSDRILIYSYMENGSLDYWLHEKPDGGSVLDWNTRLRIAQGAAQGLSYLHESHVLHRDIKSSNILLDENFEAHLADFGLARNIQPSDTHVSTDLVGTLGYIPPEYGQASVATFRGDVYSFGVVLLELLTGRRPMDMCKPKGCRDLITWVHQMKREKRECEVFDAVIYDKMRDRELLQVLEVSCCCLNESPKMRPSTQQIVSWLDDIVMSAHSER